MRLPEPDPASPPLRNEDLIGAWRLVSYVHVLDDGTVRSPLGRDAYGLLLYSADGLMSAVLCRRARAPLSAPNLATAPAEELAPAARGYLHYAGRWHLRGDCVVHTVEAALYPNWIGGEQVRRAELLTDGEAPLLTLCAALPGATARLTWRRAG